MHKRWAICSGAWVVTGPRGGLALTPVRSHQCGLGRSPPGSGTNGPMCSQTLLRARCLEERDVYQVFHNTTPGERRGELSQVSHARWTLCIQIRHVPFRTPLYGTHTHMEAVFILLIIGAVHKMKKCIPVEFASIYSIWSASTSKRHVHTIIPAVLHARQSWPLRSDVLFKVLNNYHLSVFLWLSTSGHSDEPTSSSTEWSVFSM